MKFLTTIICFLFFLSLNAQVLDMNYIRFDTTNIIQHQLQFKDDSTVVMQTGFGSSLPFLSEFNYTILGDTILIYNFEHNDNLHLIKEGEALVNHQKKLIYIKENHPNHNYTIVIINDEKLIVNLNNWATINDTFYEKFSQYNLDAFDLELINGYNAYIRFGYDYVFGVMHCEPK